MEMSTTCWVRAKNSRVIKKGAKQSKTRDSRVQKCVRDTLDVSLAVIALLLVGHVRIEAGDFQIIAGLFGILAYAVYS